MIVRLLATICLFVLAGCNSLMPRKLPDEAPPLVDMEVSFSHAEEPADEGARLALDLGSFTGLVLTAASDPDDPEEEAGGLLVKRVVENSPADAAGIEEDDILFAATGPDGRSHDLSWPSQWRKLELETAPGQEITVTCDRAGIEREVRLRVIARVRAPGRVETERFRENKRVGVVLRTATEVEARASGIGPGGGAVVIGLARSGPWRKAGIRYGDLITTMDGKPVDHPQVVLDAIRDGDETVTVTFVRNGKDKSVETALSRRKRDLTEFSVPLLFSWEKDRGDTDWSVLLGLVGYESTAAAWKMKLLWFIRFGGGDADELKEVDNP